MIITGAAITVMTAQEVADALHYAYTEGRNELFKLTVRNDDGEYDLWVHPDLDTSPDRLSDHAQSIPCRTEDGDKLEILLPARRRSTQPAGVAFVRRSGADQ